MIKVLSGVAAMTVWLLLIVTQFYYAPNCQLLLSSESMPTAVQQQMLMDILKHCP